MNIEIPVVGFIAYSGTGKTTLLKTLLPLLQQRDIRVGMIKHAHHDFDIDKPGKDSYELRKSGAQQMLVASDKRWALMVENGPSSNEIPNLEQLIRQLDTSKLDIILIEGYKNEDYPKIELHRSGLNNEFIYPTDSSVIALISDKKPDDTNHPVWIDLNKPEQVLEFLLEHFLKK